MLKKRMSTPLIAAANEAATLAHGEQKRKYTGLPYITHCQEVANLVSMVGASDEVVAAALLHDTLEDTKIDPAVIEKLSPRVLEIVRMVTDVSRPEDGNRKTRKAMDLAHLSLSDHDGSTVKLADIISNSSNILGCDLAFAKVYIPEMKQYLEVLTKGDERLYKVAAGYVLTGEAHLKLLGH